MDDTNQQNPTDMTGPAPVPQSVTDPMAQASSLSDLAGMAPVPAPAPVPPMEPAAGTMGQDVPMQTVPAAMNEPSKDDYSYAEDILDEILDSLDRIEAKVEAIEKKLG